MALIPSAREVNDLMGAPSPSTNFLFNVGAAIGTGIAAGAKYGTVSVSGISGQDVIAAKQILAQNGYKVSQTTTTLRFDWDFVVTVYNGYPLT